MKPSKSDIAEGIALLRSIGWLSNTAPDFQDSVLALAQWHWFAAGTSISHGGDTSGGIYCIARGSVSAIPTVGAADTPIMHIANAPFWFGANPLLNGQPRSMSVLARSPCLVALVPQHGVAALLADNPGRWQFISLFVFDFMILLAQISTDLMIRDTRRRCIAVLLRVAGSRISGTAPAVAGLTHEELAAMAVISRQTTGPILRALAEEGLLSIGYRSITLHDPSRLRAMIAG